jgi:peptidoglycan/LPS O-acetylase OafA/YrhL
MYSGQLLLGRRHFSPRSVITVLLVLAGLSFVISVVLLAKNQPWAFFHTETLIWQLAVGGLLAAAPTISSHHTVCTLLVGSGIAGIVASIAWLDDAFPYPGWYALEPTLSAAVVIAGGGGSLSTLRHLRIEGAAVGRGALL